MASDELKSVVEALRAQVKEPDVLVSRQNMEALAATAPMPPGVTTTPGQAGRGPWGGGGLPGRGSLRVGRHAGGGPDPRRPLLPRRRLHDRFAEHAPALRRAAIGAHRGA